MFDIADNPITIGDEVIGSPSGWYGVIRMKIIKETKNQIKYLKYSYAEDKYQDNEYKMNKSSNQFRFYKIC